MSTSLGRTISTESPSVSFPQREAILSADVSLERRTLWFGSAELYEDILVVSGWTWTGSIEWTIPLESVQIVERWSVLKGPNFVFHTEEGALHCRIEGAAWNWEQALKNEPGIELKMRS